MNITEPFVLKDDVLLIPCSDLSDDLRGRISFDDGDFTLSRRHGRSASQVVDGDTAALLTLFREPRTIVAAVIENSRTLGRDAEERLDEMLPHIGVFLQNRVLVPVGSDDEQEIRPRFESGALVAGWEIVRCVSLIEDSEIYLLSKDGVNAALKIARTAMPFEESVFGNEAAILRHINGGIAPRLIDCGTFEERPYLIIDWIPGVEAGVAASQRRHDRASLIELCSSVAAAYAALHERGVLHSDVHPRNVLVGDDGRVTLIDFGLSRFTEQQPRTARGGMYYFFEPEFLAGQRQGLVMPSSAAGEQYALAALLYLLVSGSHYLEFRYDREEMARQAELDPPLPFAKRGIPPWPEVEQILFRGLEKDPALRHPSIGKMAALLSEASGAAARDAMTTPLTDQTNEFVEAMLRSFARGGAMFTSRYTTPPTASINNGCAGAAVGLLRIAGTRSDSALLALAGVWSSRAMALTGSNDAYYNADADLPREILGEVTPYHTEAGIHAAAAMVAEAMGDGPTQQRCIAAFLVASRKECAQLDLTLGRSGSLLAAAMLLEAAGNVPDSGLRDFGAGTMAAIWNELDAHPPLPLSPPGTYLGMAHGWSGYFYAALRWCSASGDTLPARFAERIHDFKQLRTQKGRGAYWRRTSDGPALDAMPGWCNGSAGQVFLWTLAHRLLGDDECLDLAVLSAWHTWEEPCMTADLCCGSAGRAYALLNLYKQTGATEWLSRARQLANHAASAAHQNPQRANSLWKGELGVAVLIADLASPENAAMPFFER
jgi:predicted Ser/Thr protein kinase